jgi:hypothetical protein
MALEICSTITGRSSVATMSYQARPRRCDEPVGLRGCRAGDGLERPTNPSEGERAMSEPDRSTEAAGQGLSDDEMVEKVAEQTDSASENAYVAGKDWDGDPGSAPESE